MRRLIFTRLIFAWIYFRGCKFRHISRGFIFADREVLITIYNIQRTIYITVNSRYVEFWKANVRDCQSSRYRETGFKQKKSPDIQHIQLYFHITNDNPWIVNKIIIKITFTTSKKVCKSFSPCRKASPFLDKEI